MRKFLHLFHKEVEFDKIEGYKDIKDIVMRALDSEDNYNLLFVGPSYWTKSSNMEYISISNILYR